MSTSSTTTDDLPLTSGSYPPPVTISTHLREDTWPIRADPREDIIVAWRRARPLDVSHAEGGIERVPYHDEARYDAWTNTVLFRRSEVLTTCYSVDLEDITNDCGRAVREAVREQFWRAGGNSVSRNEVHRSHTEATHE